MRNRRHAAPPARSAITLSLGYRLPYDWDQVLGFLAARAIPGVEAVSRGVYRRTVELSGSVGTVSVAHEPNRCRLRATICFPQTGALPVIIARLRRMFDLGADPAVIGAALSQDARLRPLVAAHPGLRVPGAWDGFELGVRAIVGQQVTVAAATRLAGRIARTHGVPWVDDGSKPELSHVFPQPEILADATVTGMPAARAEAIAGLARAVVAAPGLFERGIDLAHSVGQLRILPGIGEWTAQYVAMRAMREPDAFPASDIGLLRAMDEGLGRPSAATMLIHAEAWRPWRAYAAMHLWNSLTGNNAEASDALAA